MPMKKPSSVDALARAAAIPPAGDPVIHELDEEGRREREEHAKRTPPPKPVRINLSVPPDLYRDFLRWAERQADVLDVPKLSDQKALRGLIRGVIGSPEATAAVRRGLSNEVRGID